MSSFDLPVQERLKTKERSVEVSPRRLENLIYEGRMKKFGLFKPEK